MLTRAEIALLSEQAEWHAPLFGELLYGTGMRIMEGVRLRVKDVDFGRREILVRDGKGAKDRVTMLPRAIGAADLRRQLDESAGSTTPTSPMDTARSGCPRRWNANIRPRRASGAGNTYSSRIAVRSIRVAASRGAIT